MALSRIAHIVFRESDLAHAVRESHLVPQHLVSRGYRVENVPVSHGIEATNHFDRVLLDLVFAEAGLRAARDGFDALLITPFSDYGVGLLRSAVSIPVIGGGQSAMQLAAGLARKFAIVTVWPRFAKEVYERHLEETGFTGRCSEVVYVTEDREIPGLIGTDGAIRAMGRDRRGQLLDRIELAARGALERGAGAIVLGCTCMSPIREELVRRLAGAAPVLDPLVAGYKLAEVTLACGLRHRPEALPSAHVGQLTAMIKVSQASTPLPAVCGDTCSLMDDAAETTAPSTN
jgi:allantoin racemase